MFSNSLWNTLQPVNGLSPEILSRIVQYVPGKNNIDARAILLLTHVCRYWRESIISAPEHWTLISSDSTDLTALSLGRSKAALLEFRLRSYRIRDRPGFSDLIFPYLKNTKTLDFSDFLTIEEFRQRLPNFPQSMPNLRSLTLAPWLGGPDWDPFIDPFGSFPHTLRCLSLHYFPLYPSFLKLRTLTELTLRDYKFIFPMDTLLVIVEGNPSLERVSLSIDFAEPSLRDSQRRTVAKNQLRSLSISCLDAMDARALVSGIFLPRGAHLEIHLGRIGGLADILAGLSMAHLANLPLPTFMESRSSGRHIRLSGQNGSFSINSPTLPEVSFLEFPLLRLHNIRELWLDSPTPKPWTPISFCLRFFHALTTLVIKHDVDTSNTLSTLFSTPSSSPPLKTLAFLDCVITEDFMKRLIRFASDRKNITQARLHRVVIAHRDGDLPSDDSVCDLEDHVPVVEVLVDTKLPTDLT